METLDGGKTLVESAATWDGGETESPLQKDWDPMAIPLSGELRLWAWSELGLEAGGRVEPVGEAWGWEREVFMTAPL